MKRLLFNRNVKQRMKILIAIICIIPFVTKAQPGNISGNAYWKYNDYVGNKPDAGSDVLLYNLDSPQFKKQNQCDVQGNFRFDNLQPGRYFLVVSSKATNTDGSDNISMFKIYETYTQQMFGIDITTYPQYDSLALYQSAMGEIGKKKFTIWNTNKRTKEVLDALHDYRMCCMRLWNSVRPKDRDLYMIMMGFRKVHLTTIDVKPSENSTAIIDFGTTFR